MKTEIRKLNAFYGKKQALYDVSLDINGGEITALTGRNGSGKSTLAACLGSSVKYSGDILINGKNLKELKQKETAQLVSVMPQLLNAPHITVKELVTFGRSPYLSPVSRPGKTDCELIEKAIADAELKNIENCFLDEISGGELRRAYLGMILAQNTSLIVLDEATAYMDADNETKFLNLVTRLKTKHNKAILCIMHNLSDAVQYADNIAVMDSGRIIFSDKTDETMKTDIIEKTFNVRRFEADGRIFFA